MTFDETSMRKMPSGIAGFDPFTSGGLPLREDETRITSERLCRGGERLDTMVGGGYYCGANVLVNGFSGTAKTTLGDELLPRADRAEESQAGGERYLFYTHLMIAELGDRIGVVFA